MMNTTRLFAVISILSVFIFAYSVSRTKQESSKAVSSRQVSTDLLRDDFFASPFMLDKDLMSIFDEMNRHHEKMMSSMLYPFNDDPFVWPTLRGNAVSPYAIEEDEKGVTVTVNMPKIDMKDISIELIDGSVLHIHGGRATGSSSMQFDKMFALGRHMDSDHIEAKLHDGKLKITTPKVGPLPEKVRLIDIKPEL